MRHQCLIYEGSPAKYLPGLAATLIEHLRANRRCAYFNSPAMVAGFRSYLAAAGIAVADEIARGRIVLSSAVDHLIDGRFDPSRMLEMLSISVDDALRDGFDGLWATGDMAWEFGSERNFQKLLDYEYGLEDLFQRQPALFGICQYHRDLMPFEACAYALCSHPAVFVNETLSRMNPHYVPRRGEQPSFSPVEFDRALNRLAAPCSCE